MDQHSDIFSNKIGTVTSPKKDHYEDWLDFVTRTLSICTFLSLGILGYELFLLKDKIESLSRRSRLYSDSQPKGVNNPTSKVASHPLLQSGFYDTSRSSLEKNGSSFKDLHYDLPNDCLYPLSALNSITPKFCLNGFSASNNGESWSISVNIYNLDRFEERKMRGLILGKIIRSDEDLVVFLEQKSESLLEMVKEGGESFHAMNYSMKALGVSNAKQGIDNGARGLFLVNIEGESRIDMIVTRPLSEYPATIETGSDFTDPAG
jgi:hypothetical protein